MPELEENKFKKFCGTLIPRVGSIATIGLSFTLAIALILNGFIGLEEVMVQNQHLITTNVAAVSSTKKKDIDTPALSPQTPKETNRIVVKYKDNPPGIEKALARANLEKAEGLKKLAEVTQIGAVVYEVSENDTADEVVMRMLEKKKDVIEYAEVDMLVAPTLTPNDPYFGSSWHHSKIQTPVAWDVSLGTNIKVAVLDSGVTPHPDLSLATDGWNFYDNNADTTDVHNHGTWVAGTAGAIINNGTGVVGVSPAVQILPIRISDTTGYAYWSTIANGITYAADHGARVANVSYAACNSASIISAATYMRSKGGVVTVSAGNTGADDGTVANGALTCVSATDSTDTRTSWSSFGAYVDVSAPGASIYTTNRSGGYSTVQGTSFSAPITGAIYALIFSANPALTPAQADSILFSSVDDIGTAGWDAYYGYGRVNATKAVQAARATVGTRDTTAPIAPANLRTSNVSSNSVSLTWNASTDDVGVTGYGVYRNGVKVATVSGTTYTNTGLTPETTYAYAVTAEDAAGNQSAQSASTSVKTLAVEFGIASFSVPTKTTNSATVSATLTKPGTVTIKYGTTAANLNLSAQSAISGTNHSISLSGLTSKTTYYYQVIATDGVKTVSSVASSFKTAASGGGKPGR